MKLSRCLTWTVCQVLQTSSSRLSRLDRYQAEVCWESTLKENIFSTPKVGEEVNTLLEHPKSRYIYIWYALLVQLPDVLFEVEESFELIFEQCQSQADPADIRAIFKQWDPTGFSTALVPSQHSMAGLFCRVWRCTSVQFATGGSRSEDGEWSGRMSCCRPSLALACTWASESCLEHIWFENWISAISRDWND